MTVGYAVIQLGAPAPGNFMLNVGTQFGIAPSSSPSAAVPDDVISQSVRYVCRCVSINRMQQTHALQERLPLMG